MTTSRYPGATDRQEDEKQKDGEYETRTLSRSRCASATATAAGMPSRSGCYRMAGGGAPGAKNRRWKITAVALGMDVPLWRILWSTRLEKLHHPRLPVPSACEPTPPRPAGRIAMAPRSTTRATAPSRPCCTAWCSSTPRASSLGPKRPSVPAGEPVPMGTKTCRLKIQFPVKSDRKFQVGDAGNESGRSPFAVYQLGHHPSTNSSVRTSRDCGIVMPNALVVLRLMTSSNRVGCSTGMLAGLAPFRMRST